MLMLNGFYFRILGRHRDPLVGVHDGLLDGRGLVVPVCAGLAKRKDYVQNKVIYFTTIIQVVSSDVWTLLLSQTTDICLAREIKRKTG